MTPNPTVAVIGPAQLALFVRFVRANRDLDEESEVMMRAFNAYRGLAPDTDLPTTEP